MAALFALTLIGVGCASGISTGADEPTVEGDLRIVQRLAQQGAFHLAWSPDGRLLAVDSGDGSYAVWDTTSGRKVRELRDKSWGRFGGGVSLAFSGDGKHVIVPADVVNAPRMIGGKRVELGAWNIETGAIDAVLLGPDAPANRIGLRDFAVAGERLAVLYQNNESATPRYLIAVYDTRTWQLIDSWPVDGSRALAFDRTGTLIAVGRSSPYGGDDVGLPHGQIRIYDAASGRLVTMLDGVHQSIVTHLAFVGSNRIVSTASQVDRGFNRTTLRSRQLVDGDPVRIWDLASGNKALSFRVAVDTPYALSSGGGVVALSGTRNRPGRFWVWDTEGPREVGRLSSESTYFTAVAVNPDGRTVAIGNVRLGGEGFEVLVVAIGSTGRM